MAPRQGRLLVGWLDERSAASYGPLATTALREHGARARACVESRSPYSTVATPRAFDDESHEDLLRAADPTVAAQSKVVRWVTLDELRVRQVAVELDDEMSAPSREDLAAVTIPVSPVAAPVAAFDEAAGAWVLGSEEGSLAIVGRYSGPVEGTGAGTMGFGFVISAQPSRVEVLEFDGALVLVDGHHRALRLWRSGVSEVPALVRPGRREDLVADDGVDPDWLLSSRPPRLADYLDDEVSVGYPATPATRSLVLQATTLKLPRI